MSTGRSPRSTATPGHAPAGAEGSPYELIKQAILGGRLAPGQALVELGLATWAGVSRTPIREALRRLEQDGLVQRAATGLVVRERSPEEILDLYDTRIVLEATVARVAAERRSDYDLRRLRHAVQRGHDVSPDNNEQIVQANEEFHRALWQASHNESLIDLLQRLRLHLGRYPGTTLVVPGRWDTAQCEHESLIDAIDRRDGRAAHRLAEQHFVAGRNIRLELLAAESGRD